MMPGSILFAGGFMLAVSDNWIADRLFYGDAIPHHLMWLSSRLAMMYGFALVFNAWFAS